MENNNFKPAWWLPASHLQTLWPALCRRRLKNLPLVNERLELPDGDFIDLVWAGNRQAESLVIVLHGMEGSINSHYIKGMLRSLTDQGWCAVLMHFRGCSGEHNRLPRSYHSGDTEDIEYVTHLLKNRGPFKHFAAVGFSLGGNVLLKWLGEARSVNCLDASVAISVPFEPSKLARHMQSGFIQRMYQRYFMHFLRTRILEKFKVRQVPAEVDLELLSIARTVYEFDSNVTVPLHGFSSVHEYYERSGSRQYLHGIRVPTLIIHAKDDPLMTEDVIPQEAELSTTITMEVTEKGGHVGFVAGTTPWKPVYWLEQRAVSYLQAFLK